MSILSRLFRPTVENQIEQINDLVRGNLVDVIVQLDSDSRADVAMRRAATEILSRRRKSLAPRELIQNAKRHSKSKSRKGRMTIADHKRVAAADLKSMLKTTELKPTLARMESKFGKPQSGSKSSKYVPPSFWSSKSMLLQMTKSELTALPKAMPNVRDIHVNRKLSIPIVKESKPLAIESEDRLSTTWGLGKTNAFGAWGVYGAEGQNVTVAVLDTGIDANHPDLEGKIAAFAEFDDQGTIISTEPRDSDEHGTHVAGTIAGGNASGRYIGMAPQAEIAAGLVLDGNEGGTDAQVLAGIEWAVENEVDVINMSLGGLIMDNSTTPPTYTEAIVSAILAGIPVVCAIGNEGEQTTGLPGSDLFALAVGATDAADRSAGFSGGRTQIIFESDFLNPSILPIPYIKPDLSAPGVAVRSSVPDGGYKAFSGTSMATPHVSGAIALLKSAIDFSDLEGADLAFGIQELITGSVDDIGENGQDSRYGFGRLDALRAIDFAVSQGFPLDL